MNLLHANDRPGEYPASWYAATATPPDPLPQLRGETRADVAIVGGGYTGLSAALHLARAGLDVALVEAHRVGFGASGRNGGQVGSGQRQDQDKLEKTYGRDIARALWELGQEGKRLVREALDQAGLGGDWRPGIAWADWTARGARDTAAYADRLARDYGYDQVRPLDRVQMRALIGSDAFHGGLIDTGAGHVHPLRYAFALARLAADAGARVFELSEASAVAPGVVTTAQGVIRAQHVILACNGYLGGLSAPTAARVMPINNYIVATEPLGTRAAGVLAQDIAVADSRFVVNYWRLSEDKRLLFGGGESYGYRFPADIAALVRKPMLEIYPQLADVKIDYAWGGTLGITRSRMPDFARLGPGLWSASGYSGHGLAIASLAGKLLAQAIQGDAAGFDLMARTRPAPFPGLSAVRGPLQRLAMSFYALRDRFGV